jgi:hypothetical protein
MAVHSFSEIQVDAGGVGQGFRTGRGHGADRSVALQEPAALGFGQAADTIEGAPAPPSRHVNFSSGISAALLPVLDRSARDRNISR